jgi:hypothetical protein
MRFGRILAVLVFLLVLGGVGAGLWYWKSRTAFGAAASVPVVESDSTLARRVSDLHDSLQKLDDALREAQQTDTEPAVELAKRQSDLWARYTWARVRLSELRDARADTTGATTKDAAGLGSVLGSLAIYVWVVAGVVAALVLVLAWWLFRRSPQDSPVPLTEPTMTRLDRNVRMPVPAGDRPAPAERKIAPEPTFSQMRAARATEPLLDDLPAAPLPKTGRHAWENTTSQPQTNLPTPSEPTVVQDYVVSMAKRGRTSSEIARRLRIPQDQVDLILKLRRNG